MCQHQAETLIKIIISRSLKNQQAGGDGFVSAQYLHFDTGLNPRTIIRKLNEFVTQGFLEHRQESFRKPHFYRIR
ncbi:hypothetical protein [Serratia fonticola]|uniref:hypothetical protein n=1 Tax=Serratia fonticola TaxID=47917 RepID=UPI00301BE51F